MAFVASNQVFSCGGFVQVQDPPLVVLEEEGHGADCQSMVEEVILAHDHLVQMLTR